MKRLLKISTICVLLLSLTFGLYSYKVNHASAACGSGFSFCRTVTIDHTKVPNTDQASFPVLVCFNGAAPCNTSLAGLNQTGAGNHVTNSNGYDIIFTTDSACTTQVTAWEIETYVASTGELEAWVNDGTISHTVDTVFYMCYGKASISTFQGGSKGSAWDSNYAGVYHYPNGSSLSLNDSTSNANNASAQSVGSGATAPSATTGKIDGGVQLAGSTSAGAGVNVLAPHIAALDSTRITVSAWIKSTDTGTDNILDRDDFGSNRSYQFRMNANKLQFIIFVGGTTFAPTASSTINDGNWHYVVGTFDGTTVKGYVDGSLDGSNPASGNLDAATGKGLALGYSLGGGTSSQFFVGQNDESSQSSIARSADWIATEYNNQNSPSTFETFSVESSSTTASGPMAPILNETYIIKNSRLKIVGN